MNAILSSWFDSTASTPSGAIARYVVLKPIGKVASTVEVATSITEIELESRFTTYTFVPDGFTTAAVGVVPTVTGSTVTAAGSNIATVVPPAPAPKFAA